MTELASFGEWLKRQRMGRGLTQEQLASQIGCAAITLRKIEAEERRPSAEIVNQLVKILEIPQNEKDNFLKFARGDWTKAPNEDREELPWQATSSTRTNLPTSLTSFIGREKELNEVIDLLIQYRLVTLTGPGGIGKTRLSIESARTALAEFPDGVFFVALAPLSDPNLIARTVVQSLGFVEHGNIPAEQQLREGIGGRTMLIVLDNCEHLIEGVSALASDLLSTCPRIKIIATSRESLRVPGEWLYAVPALGIMPEENMPLDLGTASQSPMLRLFAERARAVRSDFTFTNENLQAVSSICLKLDGLPLAIELIAAQMRMYSPQSLLQRLNDRFILSVQGAREVPARQISLGHAIGWSYDSLTPDEQRLFAYLSVFSGGFTLSAVETIFSERFAETSVSGLLTTLLDKSLLQRSEGVNGELRLSMLVTIQHFAWKRITQSSEFPEVRNWHLAYFVHLAERGDAETRGPNQLEWMDRLEGELGNFRAALDWCVVGQKAESALRLLNALKWTWGWRGYDNEVENWFNKVRLLPNVMEYPARYASLLTHIGERWLNIDVGAAKSILDESHDIWLKLGNDGERGLADVLSALGTLALYNEKDIEKARGHFEESLRLHQKYEDEQETAWLIHKLGTLAYVAGQYGEAEKKGRESLARFQKVGNKLRAAYVLSGLGELARHQGDYEGAEVFWEQNIEIFQELRVPHAAHGQAALASVSFRRGDYDKAKSLFKNSLKVFRENRDMTGVASCLAGLAGILGTAGKPEQAARLFGAAEMILKAVTLEPADQADFDNFKSLVRESLSEVAFEKASEEGRAMTMEQAIAYALEDNL